LWAALTASEKKKNPTLKISNNNVKILPSSVMSQPKEWIEEVRKMGYRQPERKQNAEFRV
jgi:hypothetical protein